MRNLNKILGILNEGKNDFEDEDGTPSFRNESVKISLSWIKKSFEELKDHEWIEGLEKGMDIFEKRPHVLKDYINNIESRLSLMSKNLRNIKEKLLK